jgi:hypothetical protein
MPAKRSARALPSGASLTTVPMRPLTASASSVPGATPAGAAYWSR